jgi:hypothetical protein
LVEKIPLDQDANGIQAVQALQALAAHLAPASR